MKTKQITVQYTTRKSSSNWATVPKIQMEGFWLESLGYHVGDRLVVEYDDSGIRIRPLTAEEKAEQRRKELENAIRQRTEELKKLQKETAEEICRLAMVAEKGSSYRSADSLT